MGRAAAIRAPHMRIADKQPIFQS
ncbi:protein of unknown function [Burkholderia multivorans]